ncbi:glycoside hydrolase family 15 protein [Aplosporella prunicola CBS 121167]|uniref:Glycoside hydrolase family 15 protein n=1 Tax=Aplosporella prunicola CBS 121167 TaxID=1176127 RepID=A0A6A6BWR6_9PEZI|nr:glycoside hydrolase family 15 protein [Aplosporella prunicola CBS 121167]KAF2147161.1 glycoside hydrolase family 15 protein [Aplosporella prunicola CBS 121167]
MNPPANMDPQEDHGIKHDPTSARAANKGYMPIEHYGLIGNMRTCALVATDGGLDFMCWPDFDSPSVFCRLLDKDKGGHFTISPTHSKNITTKQQYLPSSNILQTRYLHDEGVLNLVDFFPRPDTKSLLRHVSSGAPLNAINGPLETTNNLKKWLVRRVECIRGDVDVDVEVFPAFNYARDKHTTEIINENRRIEAGELPQRVIFKSEGIALELNATLDCGDTPKYGCPAIFFKKKSEETSLGEGITATFHLHEGQAVSFILRDSPRADLGEPTEHITTDLLDRIQKDTQKFWFTWISKSKYKGRWREVVSRSLLLLKLLTYEPTGAIVAAPTFSLPEDFGGARNWDYRFSWVRDSSFTIYILLRMGFKEEAEAYMSFMTDRFRHSRTKEGALPIMFSIRGDTDLPEIELEHLEGYRGSRPVRIGNGAAFHKQLDIYGELLDGIYLYNKYGKPVSYDQWCSVREIADYVCTIWQETDMSIWEVRGRTQNFVYSKMMLWVALDRAQRLAEKRAFPCHQRHEWLRVRDDIYEDVMRRGFNQSLNCFIQSYEENEILDSAVLIAPLVFFIAPNDPRFLSTLDQILKPPEKGGLTSTGLVYRYNWLKSDDGVGGREGAFSMCTFWLVEALTRAGAFDKKYLVKAINIFENMLSYSNHLAMFSEEIARSGEQLGNTPQAFSHLALISAAFNLDRVTGGSGGV